MSINSGSNGLSYASNYPVPGIDQSSQQFRDNFLIIKNAVEFLQSASSSSSSMFSLVSSINSAGSVNFDINYKNNALVLPIGDPTTYLSSGMIRFNSALSNTEFHDGTAWRPLVYKDSAGAVTMTGRLILNVQPTQPSDAVTLSYVTAQFTNSANALAAQSYATNASVLAVQTDLNNEKVNRIAADTVLQNEIDAINQNMANNSGTANSISGEIASLSLRVDSNTRNIANAATNDTVNTLTDRVNAAEVTVATYTENITLETTNRIDGDQHLYNVINAITSSSGLSDEIASRIAGDLALANSISILNDGLIAEKTNRESADASIISSINSLSGQSNDKVYRTGDTMTGDLIMDAANIIVDAANIIVDGYITATGSITAQGDVIGFSDVSLKSNIKPIENALDKVSALNGVTYTRIDIPNEPKQMGLIAQEVQSVVPEVVRDVGNDLLGVTYGNLTALLIEAIKELRAEVNELKSRLP